MSTQQESAVESTIAGPERVLELCCARAVDDNITSVLRAAPLSAIAALLRQSFVDMCHSLIKNGMIPKTAAYEKWEAEAAAAEPMAAAT